MTEFKLKIENEELKARLNYCAHFHSDHAQLISEIERLNRLKDSLREKLKAYERELLQLRPIANARALTIKAFR